VQEDDKMKEALHRLQVGGCMSQGLRRGKAMKVKAQVGRAELLALAPGANDMA
jgi:hypothetical protein